MRRGINLRATTTPWFSSVAKAKARRDASPLGFLAVGELTQLVIDIR